MGHALWKANVAKRSLQEAVGPVDAFDELFTSTIPEGNHGLHRTVLTSAEGSYLAETLRRVRNDIQGNPPMQECTLSASVVLPLLSLIIQSAEYKPTLGSYCMCVGHDRSMMGWQADGRLDPRTLQSRRS